MSDTVCLKARHVAAAMAPQLRALAALKKHPGSISSTHMVAHNSNPRGSDTFFWTLWAPDMHMMRLHICKAKHSYTQNNKA